MGRLIFYNAKLVLKDSIVSDGYVVVNEEKITDVGVGKPHDMTKSCSIDCNKDYLSPGFIECHAHGGGGADFMDGSVAAFLTAAKAHLRHGTTTVCPTSLTSSDKDLFLFLDNYAEAKGITDNMPHLGGIHLEGPYFSPAQAGAQPPEYLQTPSPERYNMILERAQGNIVRWSVAPELPGALELGDELARRGIIASIGHTNADYEQIIEALRHGYTHMTHFYSAMSSVIRKKGFRILGAIEAGYMFDELRIEIIADGMHLPPELIKLILKCKPHSLISLVSDSMRGAGMTEGPSILGSLKDGVPVIIEDGIAKLPDRSSFAGSVATGDRLVRVMTKKVGIPLWEAVRMISLHPAQLLGIDGSTGGIEIGKLADLVLFDEDINIKQVYVGGRQITSAE